MAARRACDDERSPKMTLRDEPATDTDRSTVSVGITGYNACYRYISPAASFTGENISN